MRLLRAISAFCVLLLLVSVQCRAKCVAVPHETAKHSPECPLHKNKAPETKKCTHAPQWDVDDVKQFVAEVASHQTFVSPLVVPVLAVVLPQYFFTPAPPPLILRV